MTTRRNSQAAVLDRPRPALRLGVSMLALLGLLAAPLPLRAAAKPLRTPDTSDLRSENRVHTPPVSIAPTPR